MQSWLALAVLAQFVFAITTLVDKHIVVRAQHIGRPVVYTFYVSLLSGFVIVLFPFVHVPDERVFALSLINAVAFTSAIYLLYNGLARARASDVSPAVGGVSAIMAMLLAAILIEGDVGQHFLAILLLAAGTAVISRFHFSPSAFYYTLAAGCAFGLAAVTAKLVFLEVPFLDGFFWTRMMNVVCALSLLLVPPVRRAIFHGGKHSTRKAKGLVLGNKILGGIAAAMTAFAVSIGSVSVVNALGGMQFLFLFLFALFLGRFIPVSEARIGGKGGWHSFLGVALIALGLAALALS